MSKHWKYNRKEVLKMIKNTFDDGNHKIFVDGDTIFVKKIKDE